MAGQAVDQLSQIFAPKPEVRAFILGGSLATMAVPEDVWSDVDIYIILADQALEHFYSSTAWLAPFGRLTWINECGSPREILELMELSCGLFDELAAEVRPDYAPRLQLLWAGIESAQQNLT